MKTNREMPPKHNGKIRRGGGMRAPGRNNVVNHHIAKPRVREFPSELLIIPSNEPIPSAILNDFPEFQKPQSFFSSIEKLYPEISVGGVIYKQCWLGIPSADILSLQKDISDESGFRATLTRTNTIQEPVFVKRVHLLDAMNAMEGEYIWPDDGGLPAPSMPWKQALAKINDPLNEAYVDAIFACVASKLAEHHISPHWCKCYGTYSARVETYLYNISEEYPSIRNKPWWRRNIKRGIFSVYDPSKDDVTTNPTFYEPGNELMDMDFEDVVLCDTESSSVAENIAHEMDPDIHNASEVMQLNTPKLRLERMSSSDDNDEDETDDDDEDLDEMYAEFTNFPVQVSLLERAEGTMEELLDEEEDMKTSLEEKDTKWTAYIYQVIAALVCAQHYCGFVHNDLHTNNIMWSSTNETHLYYKITKLKNGEIYYAKVPTFGKIMKIIDFGRASYHLPEPAGFFISDAFYPGNDAGEQYNCEPFYDSDNGARIEPNPSFDLCRFAVSLLESLYIERPPNDTPIRVMSKEGSKLYACTNSKLYNIIWQWLVDDGGKNVLRKPDGKERYPDFDLYKAIAKDVHNAVPSSQITNDVFASFRMNSPPSADTRVYELFI